MNPLRNNTSSIPPDIMSGIKQIKSIMGMSNGNPTQILQQLGNQNPMFNQVLQMCKGQNPQQVFMSMCKKRGIDPNAILNELQK